MRLIEKVIHGVIGVCIIACALYEGYVETHSISKEIVIAVGVTAIVSAIILLICLLMKRLKLRLVHRLTVYLSVVALCAGVLVVVPNIPSMAYEDTIVTVKTGAKSEASKGSEVWIKSWRQDGALKTVNDLNVLSVTNMEYQSDSDAYLYYGLDTPEGGEITLSFKGGAECSISFVSHAWSGIVEISTNVGDQVEQIDLYSEEGKSIDYYVPINIVSSLKKQLPMLGLSVLGVALAVELGILIVVLLGQGLYKHQMIGFDRTPNSRRIMTTLKAFAKKRGLLLVLILVHILMGLCTAWMVLKSCGAFSYGVYIGAAVTIATAAIVCLELYLIYRLIKRMKWDVKRGLALWICALLLSLIVLGLNANAAMYEDTIVTIKTGEKNDASKNAEVWIKGWMKDGVMKDTSDLRVLRATNIEYQSDSNAYLYQNTDNTGRGEIVFSFDGQTDCYISFVKHAWSGIVEISTNANDQVEYIDLYSEEGDSAIYHVPSGIVMPLWKRLPRLSLYVLSGTLMVELAMLVLMAAGRDIISLAHGRDKGRKQKDERRRALLLGIVAVLLPITFMVFLYTTNATEILLTFIVWICIALVLITLVLYLLLYTALHSGIIAYFGCALLNIGMFCTSSFDDMLAKTAVGNGDLTLVTMLLIGGIGSIALGVACWIQQRARKDHEMFKSLFTTGVTILTGLLLFFNIPTAVRIYFEQANADGKAYIKTEYTVEPNLQTCANIYWLHCDGMIGFSAYEKYYGDIDWFRQELINRGFDINEDAEFEMGHSTSSSVPALLCPDFYDSYSVQVLAQADIGAFVRQPEPQKIFSIMRENAELVTAFHKEGYITAVSGWPAWERYYADTDEQYFITDGALVKTVTNSKEGSEASAANIREFKDFIDTLIRPLNYVFSWIDNGVEKNVIIDRISSTVNNSVGRTAPVVAIETVTRIDDRPRLTIYPFGEAHYPFDYDENGKQVTEGNTDVLAYPPSYQYAAKVLLAAIDAILSKDANAVIVLQADHGLHFNTEEEFVNAFGNDAVATDFWNQVLSAIRVPEQYRNGEESYALSSPLNMTRYLVNRFVGRNYEYLSEE